MKIIITFLLLFSTINALDIDWFTQVSAGLGGDTLGEIKYINAADEKVSAGNGLGIALGLKLKPEGNFHTAVSIGILHDSENASNGSISYTRFPLTLMEYYTYKMLRVGAGASYHFNPHVSGDGFAENASMSMESRFAPVVEASFMFSPYMHIGLEASAMRYAYHDKRIDATRVAIIFGIAMPLHKEEHIYKSSLDKKMIKELQWTQKPKVKSSKDPHYIVQSTEDVMATAQKRKKESEDKMPAYEREAATPKQTLGNTAVKSDSSSSWVGVCLDASLNDSIDDSSVSTTYDEEDERRIGREYIRHFVSNNMDTLAIEIASGSGETLDTLSSLLEIENKEIFHAKLQRNFGRIYHDTHVDAGEVYDKIISLR